MVWAKRAGIAAAMLAVVVGIAVGAMFYPYVRDDYALDGIVKAVALDWRDFGEDKARARLEYELDAQGIGLQVADDDCRLEPGEGTRTVRCAWTADIEIPLANTSFPLSFQSVASVDEGGSLR